MSDLYMRKTECYVEQLLFSMDDLTIYFDVPFDDGEDANIAEINIYNLSNESVNEITKDSSIILNAGYDGDIGAILLGVAKYVKTEWQGMDKITTIQCLDGSDDWIGMTIQRTYKEGITAEQVLNDIVSSTGLQIGAFNLPVNYVYSGGKTIKSTLKQAIVDIAKDCEAKAHVNKGKIFIRPKDEGDNIGFVLDADHGLISSPSPIEKENDGVTRKGFKVKCLLNHRISTDSLLEISSKTANGIYRVENGRHYANGHDYYTEMEVFPV